MRSHVLRGLVIVVLGSIAGYAAFAAVGPDTTATAEPVPTSAPATTTPPTTSTTAAPTTTTLPPTTAPAKGWLVIQGTGDVALDPRYIATLASEGYDYAFEGLDGALLADDLTVVNLECSPSPLGAPLDKEFTFRCDPEALEVAAAHGVEVANLANNHSQDFGVEAMLDGRRRLEEAGMVPVGVGADLDEATRPALFELEGWKVAVLGMGGVVPSSSWLATSDSPGMASGDDTDQMVAAVQAASRMADLVVVSVHWGFELETEPRPDDRARAEAMAAAGADVIFGHHPHRLGAVETVEGTPVFWTLGNFIWPRLSDASATTAIGRVVVSPRGEVSACLVPAFIERSGQPVLRGAPSCGPGG